MKRGRVEIACKTAQACEKAIGKAKKFDALRTRTDGLLRDAAARERVCLGDKEVLKVQLAREGARVEREVAYADKAEAQGEAWRVPVGVALVLAGVAVGVVEAFVDEAPSVPQLAVAGGITLVGATIVIWQF